MEVDERKLPCDVLYVMRGFLDNKTSKNEAMAAVKSSDLDVRIYKTLYIYADSGISDA